MLSRNILSFFTRNFDLLPCHQPVAGILKKDFFDISRTAHIFFHNLSLVSKSAPKNILISPSWRCEASAHAKIDFFKCYLHAVTSFIGEYPMPFIFLTSWHDMRLKFALGISLDKDIWLMSSSTLTFYLLWKLFVVC